jgi:hypothetical protein
MTPGQFEDVVAAKKERDDFVYRQTASLFVPVYQIGGAQVTLAQMMGDEVDFTPDMVPGIESTPEEKLERFRIEGARKKANRVEASARRRAARYVDPSDFDKEL